MVKRIKRWFQRQWPPSTSLTIPKHSHAEQKALLLALRDHPGWQWMMAELEHRKAGLEKERVNASYQIPSTAPAETLVRELIRIDEAIYWLGWIQDKVRRAEAMPDLTRFQRPNDKADAA